MMRNIRRKNEQVFWAPIPKAYALTRVSLAGTLSGLEQVSRGMDLRITPYALGGGRQDRVAADLDGSGFNDVGVDVKYGVSSGLNLDLTLNTDFAQVEVDEQQVNLTRFPLFFPEKRDFFLENAGMFSVKNEGGSRQTQRPLLYSSDRVGRRSARPDHRRGEAHGKGGPTQHRRDEYPDAGGTGEPWRKLLRWSIQPGHLLSLKGGRNHRQQRGDRRLAIQSHVRSRHVAGAASVLLGHRLSREDRVPGAFRKRRGRARQRPLAQPVVSDVRRIHRYPGQLQRRSRLCPPGWHPSVEAARGVGPAPRTLEHPPDGSDVGTSSTRPISTTAS